MSFRFWKRIRLLPGITLNLSKSGFSFSLGKRGFHYTIGSRGHRITAGIPGTGLFVTEKVGSRKQTSHRRNSVSLPRSLQPGFLKRLLLPAEEKYFLDGCRALLQNDLEKAFSAFSQGAASAADCAALAGYTALATGRTAEAERFFENAYQNRRALGNLFSQYGISLSLSLPVTKEIDIRIIPDYTGIILGLAESRQLLGKTDQAIALLKHFLKNNPENPAVVLSLVELLMESHGSDPKVCEHVIRLTGPISNETLIHTALMFYKAQALMQSGHLETARNVLTVALRRQKNRPTPLLHELRYLRAQVYEKLGRLSNARKDIARIYAENPDFRDVAKKIDLL